MYGLTDKTALVTGAERGIGRAIALRLAVDGATVIVNYLSDAAAADSVVQEITRAGGNAKAIQADVASAAQVAAMFDQLANVDFLINNAGTGTTGQLAELEPDDIDRVFGVNVKGATLCAKAALPRMPTGGRIINISSSTTIYPQPGMSIYTASKAAVRALTEVWARELGGHGINVNSVVPGPTSPGMLDLAPEDVKQAMARASPYGRVGQAAEIADVVAFLCSHGARWISGQHILVNGAASA